MGLALKTYQMPASGVVVLNDYRATPIFCFSNGKGWLWIPDRETTDASEFSQRNRKMLAHFGVSQVKAVGQMGIKENEVVVTPPRAMMGGHRIYVLDNSLKNDTLPSSLFADTDWLIVTRRYRGSLSTLSLPKAATILLSGAMSQEKNRQLRAECEVMHANYHAIMTEGAFVSLKK